MRTTPFTAFGMWPSVEFQISRYSPFFSPHCVEIGFFITYLCLEVPVALSVSWDKAATHRERWCFKELTASVKEVTQRIIQYLAEQDAAKILCTFDFAAWIKSEEGVKRAPDPEALWKWTDVQVQSHTDVSGTMMTLPAGHTHLFWLSNVESIVSGLSRISQAGIKKVSSTLLLLWER